MAGASLEDASLVLSGVTGPSAELVREREDGSLLRMKAVPGGLRGYVVGKVMSVVVVTVVPLVVTLLIAFALSPTLAPAECVGWIQLVGTTLLGLVATIPVGVALGSALRSAMALVFPMLVTLALLAISRVFFPLSVLPGWLQIIAQVFPMYCLGLGMRSAFLPAEAALLELAVQQDGDMTPYVRPVVEQQVFRDASGNVIDYGNRWGREGPPGDSYSVATHPERFRPLHDIADALMSHLIDTYDVTVLEDPEVAEDLLRERDDVLRAVRITARRERAASLTVVITSNPGVVVHAGEVTDGSFPLCGCDACDDSLEMIADLLEEFVLAVVEGRFWERIGPGNHPWVESGTRSTDGDNWGRSEESDLPAKRVRRARKVLADVPHGWAAWPRRDQSS